MHITDVYTITAAMIERLQSEHEGNLTDYHHFAQKYIIPRKYIYEQQPGKNMQVAKCSINICINKKNYGPHGNPNPPRKDNCTANYLYLTKMPTNNRASC